MFCACDVCMCVVCYMLCIPCMFVCQSVLCDKEDTFHLLSVSRLECSAWSLEQNVVLTLSLLTHLIVN